MAERFTADLIFILFVLIIAALLGFLIGYLLRKNKKIPELENEVSDLKQQLAALKAETRQQFFFDASKAREVFGFKISENDLKIVEGIGPKISDILVNRGINTWKALSEADPVIIKEYLLHDGGELYRIHMPDTWPYQAKLAYEGRWEELKALQDNLIGGKKA
jgi:predicted flap endonuclease-1-like 5' DNA nuclease